MNKIFKRNILFPVAFHLKVFYVTHGMRLMYFMVAAWWTKINCLVISDFFTSFYTYVEEQEKAISVFPYHTSRQNLLKDKHADLYLLHTPLSELTSLKTQD